MITLPIVELAGQTVVVLSPEAQDALGIRAGDHVELSPSNDGTHALRIAEPSFARQMALAEEIMREDHAVLAELAK